MSSHARIEPVADAAPVESEPLLTVRDMRTSFPSKNGEFAAVDGVSFSIKRGEVVGLAGESGSGKSMTALSLLGLVPRPGRVVQGTAMFDGVDLLTCQEKTLEQIRGQRIGMIFQDPQTALNPRLSVGLLLREALSQQFRTGKADLTDRAVEALREVQIPDPERVVRAYPHELSGGMRQRVMVAIAASNGPDLLLADEPTTALDVTIQAEILELLRNAASSTGAAMLLITHDLAVIAGYADRTMVMFAGRIVESGTTRQVFYSPRHPYTAELLRATPRIDRKRAPVASTLVQRPELAPMVDAGCRYAERCAHVEPRCRESEPTMEASTAGHEVACWVRPALEPG